MTSFMELLNGDPEAWINSLDDYQVNTIRHLYSYTDDYDEVAKEWLSAAVYSNAPCGVANRFCMTFEKIQEEVYTFFCDKGKYGNHKSDLFSLKTLTEYYAIEFLSDVFSPVLGLSAAYLAPLVAIVLLKISRVGLDKWIANFKSKLDAELK